MTSVQSLSANDLDTWAGRPATPLRRGHIGVTESVVQINAPSRTIDFVKWYTDLYFGHQDSPVRACLFVHDVIPELRRLAKDSQLNSPLRRAVLPASPDAICLVDDTHSTVHLFPPTGTERESMQVVVRILRALVLRALLSDGYPFFHAACFVLRGAGVALIGGRAVGKTTTLLQSLDHAKATLVSNDKFALLHDAHTGTVEALGFPIQVGIRAGSLLTLRDGPLRACLMHRWSQRFGSIEAKHGDLENRLEIRPQELAAAARSMVKPRCRLRVAIEPHLDPDAITPRLQRLSDHESRALWARNLLNCPSEVFPQQAALADPTRWPELRIPQIPTYRLIQPPAAAPLTVRLLEDLMYRVSVGE